MSIRNDENKKFKEVTIVDLKDFFPDGVINLKIEKEAEIDSIARERWKSREQFFHLISRSTFMIIIVVSAMWGIYILGTTFPKEFAISIIPSILTGIIGYAFGNN